MVGILATTILPALLPALTDGVKQIIGRFTGGRKVQPQTVAEQVQLNESEAKRLGALAELDKPIGSTSRWVADLRGSFRYIAAGAILSNAILCPLWADAQAVVLAWEAGRAAFFFTFGDRVYMHLRRG
jgi:hypothetical protein